MRARADLINQSVHCGGKSLSLRFEDSWIDSFGSPCHVTKEFAFRKNGIG